MAEPLIAPHMVLGAGSKGPAVFTLTNTLATLEEMIAPAYFADPKPSQNEVKVGDFFFIVASNTVALTKFTQVHPSYVLDEVTRKV